MLVETWSPATTPADEVADDTNTFTPKPGVASSAFAFANDTALYFGDIKFVCWFGSINWAPIPAADAVELDNKNQTSLLELLTKSERVNPAL